MASLTLRDMMCCGVTEVRGLCELSPGEFIKEFCERLLVGGYCGQRKVNLDTAFYVLTGIVNERYGQLTKAYIEKHGLGAIIEGPMRTNFNSGNRIKVWIWAPSQSGLRKWWQEHGRQE